MMFGEREVSYWIARKHWGKGLATAALGAFLEEVTIRPLQARVAHDNMGSLRVLQKCGFVITGRDKYFANGRGEEIEEIIVKLH
jgi:RimJ/RimL family protein N-acetyltransferase